MAEIASEALIRRLADRGVDTVFGLPGDGINGLMEGLRRQPRKVRIASTLFRNISQLGS